MLPVPNQPKANTSGHYISAIPDDLWAKAKKKADADPEVRGVSAVVRAALEAYVKEKK